MECLECGDCCLETEMLLSKKDIDRLEKKGFKSKYFSRQNNEGYVVLKNRKGHCIFFDVEQKRCKIYEDRPMGCRLYPIIFDDMKGIIADTLCPANNKWTENRKTHRGKKVIKLLKKIDSEAKQRCSS